MCLFCKAEASPSDPNQPCSGLLGTQIASKEPGDSLAKVLKLLHTHPNLAVVLKDLAEERFGLARFAAFPFASFPEDALWAVLLNLEGPLRLQSAAKAELIGQQLARFQTVPQMENSLQSWLSFLAAQETQTVQDILRKSLPRPYNVFAQRGSQSLADRLSSAAVIVSPGHHREGESDSKTGSGASNGRISAREPRRLVVDRYLTTQSDWWFYTGGVPSHFVDPSQTDHADALRVEEQNLLALHPVESITWWSAAAYANVRSKAAGLSPYYALDGIEWNGPFEEALASGTLEPVDFPLALRQLSKSGSVPGDGQEPGFRLPSLAEAEMIARAGSQTPYFFGPDAQTLKSYAWFMGNSAWRTHAVGMLKPNAWGIFDAVGNVKIWTDYQIVNGRFRVAAFGGAFDSSAISLRSTHQERRTHYAHPSVGLRLVRTLLDPSPLQEEN